MIVFDASAVVSAALREDSIPGLRGTLASAILCLVAVHPGGARAELRGEVVEFGEVTSDAERLAPPTRDDHTLTPRTTIEGRRYVSYASTLPAQLCLRIGVTIHLVADPAGELPGQLVVVATRPRLTRPDQVSSTEDHFPTPVLDDTAYARWTFDQPWEQQPGEWTFAFIHAGMVLANKTFTITPPTSPGSVCPPGAVS